MKKQAVCTQVNEQCVAVYLGASSCVAKPPDRKSNVILFGIDLAVESVATELRVARTLCLRSYWWGSCLVREYKVS